MSLALALAGAVVVAAWQVSRGALGGPPPPNPVWPAAFDARFTSEWLNTTGRFAVRSAAASASGERAAERIDLADGSRDHLCAHFHVKTPCTQLTTEGARFLVFPDRKDCCKCCSYEPTSPYLCGGPLAPGWVSNGEYLGIQLVFSPAGPVRCHLWAVPGLDPLRPNYYFQGVESGLPCAIDGYNYLYNPDERFDDQYIFDPASTQTSADPAFFKIPKICEGARMCGAPVCDDALVQGSR